MHYEVILDAGETPNKCTIAPLAYRGDFRLFRVKRNAVLGPLQSQVLLHPEGVCLTQLRLSLPNLETSSFGVATIDCIWRRLPTLLSRIEGALPQLARIPEGIVTAYPRQSKIQDDPEGGLATIEAIFTAAALLGNVDLSLLSEYHFGRRFIELNSTRFIELGFDPGALQGEIPCRRISERNARTRRLGRGRRVR